MVRNYPIRHTKSTAPIVLTDDSLVDAGGGEHTVADASKVAKTGDTMTGGLVLIDGANLTIGGGTALTKAVVYTPTLTPASQGANALVEQTFTVAGLTTADTVFVNAPGAVAMSVRVSAADTLALTFHAPSGGTYTAPSGVYRVVAIRS
jgi:hypothetical protein